VVGKAFPLSPSPDNVFGAGRADAFASVSATLPAWKGAATLTVDANTTFGASLAPDRLGFVDPNGCLLTRLKWTGDCGTSPGSTMTCPVGANAVSVAASNNGVAYSAVVDLQIAVTDFSLSLSPDTATVTSGQSSRHVVTVPPQGGPYNSEVTLSCASGNLPPQTTCVFDPPTVTPGTKGAQSTLTISTVSNAASALVAPTRARAAAITAQLSGIAVFPSALTFGSQTVSTTAPPQLVYLTNTGADAMTIASIVSSGDFSAVRNCGATLAPGASCAVSVSFTPTVTGTRTGNLQFVDDAPGSPHVVTLTGTGQAAPSATGGTPAGNYSVTISGTAGTSLAHFSVVTLTVQ